jgi:hypothetical protein
LPLQQHNQQLHSGLQLHSHSAGHVDLSAITTVPVPALSVPDSALLESSLDTLFPAPYFGNLHAPNAMQGSVRGVNGYLGVYQQPYAQGGPAAALSHQQGPEQ